MATQYVLGIDLGTTNSVFAYAPLNSQQADVQLLRIAQLVAPGEVEQLSSFPSFLYLAGEHQAAAGALDLPWCEGQEFAVGEMARRSAAQVPHRTVSAAKSWLCHSRVDRHAAILPWQAPDDVDRVSPVTATRRYLEHLQAAWDNAFKETPLAEQVVVLTVPASFDASARELTREAALAAGWPDTLVLLEEPQAALYAWLDAVGDDWRQQLKLGDTLLVCDVGGGTTDLTLVTVAQQDGELVLERVAVGNHLLVGGDNMDLALAHYVAGRFTEQGVNLDPWQSVSLWHACRTAKESLLAADGAEMHPVSVPGRGSRLVGGTVSVDVERSAAAQLLLDGFFPYCRPSDRPARQRQSGFQEIGLPFESDAAVTRHLAAFLQAHSNLADQPLRPTHVLFNGGVFKAPALRSRLLDVMGQWFGTGEAPRELSGERDLDYAVARGAAYYGWAKRHGGMRVRGGTARAYYVGIETAGLAVPGAPRPLRALCVVPIGMEEGTEADVPAQNIGLVIGEAAHFRFFSSPVRSQDRPGDLLDTWTDDELSETDSLETTLDTGDRSNLDSVEASDMGYVPIKFQARVTELGVLELWCVSVQDDQRWKLEFSVREDVSS